MIFLILILSPLISTDLSSTFAEIVVPDLDRPVPASTAPAPENCVNVKSVVPRLTELVVKTYPLSPFVVPCSTNTNSPDVTSALEFASSDLGAAPLPTTT